MVSNGILMETILISDGFGFLLFFMTGQKTT